MEGSVEVYKNVTSANASKANSLIHMHKSDIFYIDYEERNTVRRFDLNDSRVAHISFSAYLSSICIIPPSSPQGMPTLLSLSRVGDTLHRSSVDISLIIPADSVSIQDSEGYKYSSLEANDKHILLIGDRLSIIPPVYSPDAATMNRLLLMDYKTMREVARKDLLVKGQCGWIERALLPTIRGKGYIILAAIQQCSVYMMEIADSGDRPSPPPSIGRVKHIDPSPPSPLHKCTP